MIIDRLIEKIRTTENPSVAGLDTDFSYLPEETRQKCKTARDAAKAITEFNQKIIDELCGFVPAVKVQIAYYEIFGADGIQSFADTLAYAKSKGMITIADAKRNDIGSTAAAYAKAYLGESAAFAADFLTVNGYLGSDGINPFIDECKKNDRGIFVLVKTSNKGSGELQDLTLGSGEKVYQKMSSLTADLGKDFIGKHGYSAVGAVVGATHPAQAAEIRAAYKNLFFLVPGYGTQGGTAKDLAPCFDGKGGGAIVNSSRGIICAYKEAKFKGMSPEKAAREAAQIMKKDLNGGIL